MSVKIKYAYLNGQVWMYRRNYPADVQFTLGSQALKQSLKTADPRLARQRVTEVDTRYNSIVTTTRSGGAESDTQPFSWVTEGTAAVDHLRTTLEGLDQPVFSTRGKVDWPTIAELAKVYLNWRWYVQGLCSTQHASGSSPNANGQVPLSIGQQAWSVTSQHDQRTS